MNTDLTPQEAWQHLPAADWNPAAARHLLRRIGWAASPAEVERVVKDGLDASLERFFPAAAPLPPKPRLIANLEADAPDYAARLAKVESRDQRQMLQREMRERSQQALQDLSVKWLQFAARPENAVVEKWALFLSDVYVTSQEKVNNTALVFNHHQLIRENALGPAPVLTKAVSRSPAMVQYLDLQQSNRNAPNENFARELFELFVLGEGNYTEADIKEAARAFTGYRQGFGVFRYVPRQHDGGKKTVFGTTGNLDGDQVIDLAYRQPAAATFLPRELAKFYLTDETLPRELFAPLGAAWREAGFNLRVLARSFFSSRLFFEPAFRGAYIKSPVHFYLGLVQDLNLSVAPFPRQSLNALRLMGQNLYRPPNVRGWVGGRQWINSATLNARRQLVENLFTPLDEANLNADEQVELVAARAEGVTNFTVTDDRLAELASSDEDAITSRFVDYFLPAKVDDTFRRQVRAFLASPAAGKTKVDRIRNTAVTLLQSPDYQLC